MIDYSVILTRHFEGQWTLNGDDYDGLTWLSNTQKPTKKELDDLWPQVLEEIEIEKEAKINAKKRAEEKLAKLGLTAQDLRALGL